MLFHHLYKKTKKLKGVIIKLLSVIFSFFVYPLIAFLYEKQVDTQDLKQEN